MCSPTFLESMLTNSQQKATHWYLHLTKTHRAENRPPQARILLHILSHTHTMCYRQRLLFTAATTTNSHISSKHILQDTFRYSTAQLREKRLQAEYTSVKYTTFVIYKAGCEEKLLLSGKHKHFEGALNIFDLYRILELCGKH